MPSQTTEETRPERTMRNWYEAKIAQWLLHGVSMEKNRQMLRRGAIKQQDGTLGEAGGPEWEEEPVNISIGDTHNTIYGGAGGASNGAAVSTPADGPTAAEPATPTPAEPTAPTIELPEPGLSNWAKAGILAAALGVPSAGIIGYLAGQGNAPQQPPAAVDTDTDTTSRLTAE